MYKGRNRNLTLKEQLRELALEKFYQIVGMTCVTLVKVLFLLCFTETKPR